MEKTKNEAVKKPTARRTATRKKPETGHKTAPQKLKLLVTVVPRRKTDKSKEVIHALLGSIGNTKETDSIPALNLSVWQTDRVPPHESGTCIGIIIPSVFIKYNLILYDTPKMLFLQ